MREAVRSWTTLIAFFVSFVFFVVPSSAAAAGVPEPVAAALARARVPLDAAGIVVEPVESGSVVVSHRADVPMNPASTIKLVTSFAALDLLGPAFTFRTDFLLQGTLDHGVLDGNLVIHGGGDPKLTYERLWQAAHQLRARGLREIRGDVIIDRGYFAPVAHDPGKFDGESRRAYNVGIDAFLVNFQAVNFSVIPDGGGARVTMEPDLPNVQVVSRIALVQGACNDWRRALKVEFEENGLIATVVVSGNFPSECGEKTWPLALLDGPRYSEAAWRWVWSEAGGVLRGKVRAGATPPDARLFYRHDSEPLASLPDKGETGLSGRVLRVEQDGDVFGLREGCAQEIEALLVEFAGDKREPGDVAARTRKALHIPERDRIACRCHHDRNVFRGSHHGWHRNTAVNDDHVGREGDQFRCKPRKA